MTQEAGMVSYSQNWRKSSLKLLLFKKQGLEGLIAKF